MQLEDYTTGTASIANGSTALTGTGTAWEIAGFKAGDTFHAQGLVGIIASVDGDAAITLRDPWTGGAIVDGAYLLRFQPDNSRMQGTTRQLLDTLRNGFSLVGKSTTSLTIGTGAKTFDVGVSNLGWGSGARLRASSDADGTNFMEGVVTTYAEGSVTLNVDLVGGAGTHADWTINLAGEPGADGATNYNDLTNKPVLREVLTANRTYYVRKTGNNASDGLTPGTAFLTIQNAVNVAMALDMNIYSVTIDVGAGTFNEGGFLSVAGNGNARITIQGAGYTSTIIAGTTYGIQPKNGVALTLMNLAIQGNTVCLWPRYGAQVFLGGNISLNGGTARLIGIDNGAYLECIGSAVLYLAADSTYAFYADVLGHILIWATVKTTGPRTFTQTARAQGGGILEVGGTTFDLTAGAVTGTRYAAALNGLINTAGGGANFIPGTVAGSPAVGTVGTTGGVYA